MNGDLADHFRGAWLLGRLRPGALYPSNLARRGRPYSYRMRSSRSCVAADPYKEGEADGSIRDRRSNDRAAFRLVLAQPNWPDQSEVLLVRSRSTLLRTASVNSFRSATRDVEPIPTHRRLWNPQLPVDS